MSWILSLMWFNSQNISICVGIPQGTNRITICEKKTIYIYLHCSFLSFVLSVCKISPSVRVKKQGLETSVMSHDHMNSVL